MAQVKLYRDKATGKKLYPVCSWEKNQHKLYNAHDRAVNRCYDEGWSDEAVAEQERVERAMEAFEAHVIRGLVYATYEDSCIIKDIIGAYDVRHDMAGDWRA